MVFLLQDMPSEFYVPAVSAIAAIGGILATVIGVLWRRTVQQSDKLEAQGPQLTTAMIGVADTLKAMHKSQEETLWLVQEMARATGAFSERPLGRAPREGYEPGFRWGPGPR